MIFLRNIRKGLHKAHQLGINKTRNIGTESYS